MVIGQCVICGAKNKVTVHHLRDVHDKVYFNKKNKRRPNCVGEIHLCRECHDLVESIVSKGKLKRMYYHQGYKQGLEDSQFD